MAGRPPLREDLRRSRMVKVYLTDDELKLLDRHRGDLSRAEALAGMLRGVCSPEMLLLFAGIVAAASLTEKPRRPVVLSLYDLSGVWATALRKAGFSVIQIDSALDNGWKMDLGAPGAAQTLSQTLARHDFQVVGIVAAPPCTVFTRAGARLWGEWDGCGRTAEQLRLLDIVLELVAQHQPRFYAIENPPGRLYRKQGGGLRQEALGAPKLIFDPWQFGGYAPDGHLSRETKKTYVWGGGWEANDIEKRPHPLGPEPYPEDLPPGRRDPISRRSSAWSEWRSTTPHGFARAFAEAMARLHPV